MKFLVLDQVHNLLCIKENNVFSLPSEDIIRPISSQLIIWKKLSLLIDNQTEYCRLYIYKAQTEPKLGIIDSRELLWIPMREVFLENTCLEKKSAFYASEIYQEMILRGFNQNLQNFDVWYFGSDKELADELVALVLEGKKTATTSLVEEYEIEGEKIPEVGDISVIVNWDEIPKCIIETTRVYDVPSIKYRKTMQLKKERAIRAMNIGGMYMCDVSRWMYNYMAVRLLKQAKWYVKNFEL